MRRYSELDALRGIAALGVVLFHYTSYFDYSIGHLGNFEFFSLADNPGRYGVELFFMISGYVILMSLTRAQTLKDFAISRFARLYPVYWIAVTITALVILLSHSEAISGLVYIANMSMMQSFIFVPNLDESYWTLAYELMFYFLMAVLFKRGKLHKIETYCIYWLAFQLLMASIFLMVGLKFYLISPLLLATPYAQLFIAGMMFYRLHHKQGSKKTPFILCACLLLQWLFSIEATMQEHSRFNVLSCSLVSAYFVIFYCFITDKLTFLRFKPLIFLGTISYSFYLIHQKIGFIIMEHLYQHLTNPLIVISIALLATGLLACMLTFLVEKPAQKIIIKKYKHRLSLAEKNQP